MRPTPLALAALLVATPIVAPPLATPAVAQQGQTTSASATLIDPDGQTIGYIDLMQTPNGVLITASAEVAPGTHAFHIHETGECDPATGFQSAGGHYAPRGNEHGFMVEGGPHAGDMTNVFVHDEGIFAAQVVNDRVSLEDGAEATLFDEDGSAFIIHSGADDYQSQPAGNAGDRIACGVIERNAQN